MDTFHILTRGGEFDKRKYRDDVQRFQIESQPTRSQPPAAPPNAADLPPDLDFFKYAKRAREKLRQKLPDPPSEENAATGSKRPAPPEPPTTTRHKIVAKGANVPNAMHSFQHMQEHYAISPVLLKNMQEAGYLTPTSIQAQGCPVLLEGRHVAAISPTGTGKTLSYLLPIFALLKEPKAKAKPQTGGGVEFGVRALIIAPTNELARQIHNECNKLAQGRRWRVILFTKATASTLAMKEVRDKIDVIVSTPLRLVSALHSGTLELSNVRHLVLDEADRLLDSEFSQQVEEITSACTHHAIQKAVFSATLPAGIERKALEMLHDPVRIVVGLKDTPLPLIKQSLTYVHAESSKLPTLVDYLSKQYNPPILVFVSTQARASSLAEQLTLHGAKRVDALHAGLTDKQREDCVQRMLSGLSWVLITTEIMARGMDFKGVRGVINYDFPTSVQSYIHRVGRTGRAGREGQAMTYFTDEDAPFLKSVANVLLQSGSPVPDWINRLPKPSRIKKRLMGRSKRPNGVNSATSIGKSDAIRKRDMVAGSKRRANRSRDPKDAPTQASELSSGSV